MQDVTHIGTKLRNRLLNLLIALVIGNKVSSVAHLKMLINSVPKSIHGLVYSDICPQDRQNFESLNRIMQPKVREALSKYIMDAEGTIEYIRICYEITSSLQVVNMAPLDRIFYIWRSTFFLRAWRLFIAKTNTLNFDLNFITSNAYACVELNAQNLLILVRMFRDEGLEEFFLPTIYNSQPCEETFRKMRSMGTMNFTRVNFTLLELIHLVGRVELMNNIMYFKLSEVDVIFPRNPINKLLKSQFTLPSNDEIETAIMRAATTAVADLTKFGIEISLDQIKHCQLRDVEISMHFENDQSDDMPLDLGIASDSYNILLDHQNLKDYSNRKIPDKSNSYVNIVEEDGIKTVRKTSLMWNLSSSKDKLSSDRLSRVRGSKRKSTSRQLEFVDVSKIGQPIVESEEIKIGDWCLFKNVFDDEHSKFILGNVLSFQYSSGKIYKERYYSWEFASIFQEKNTRKIDVLALWHKVDVNGIITTFNQPKCVFIPIENYCASLLNDVVEKKHDKIVISVKHIRSVINMFQRL